MARIAFSAWDSSSAERTENSMQQVSMVLPFSEAIRIATVLHDHQRHGQRVQDVQQADVPRLRGVSLLRQEESIFDERHFP